MGKGHEISEKTKNIADILLKAKCWRNVIWADLVGLTKDSFMIVISNTAIKLVGTGYGGA